MPMPTPTPASKPCHISCFSATRSSCLAQGPVTITALPRGNHADRSLIIVIIIITVTACGLRLRLLLPSQLQQLSPPHPARALGTTTDRLPAQFAQYQQLPHVLPRIFDTVIAVMAPISSPVYRAVGHYIALTPQPSAKPLVHLSQSRYVLRSRGSLPPPLLTVHGFCSEQTRQTLPHMSTRVWPACLAVHPQLRLQLSHPTVLWSHRVSAVDCNITAFNCIY